MSRAPVDIGALLHQALDDQSPSAGFRQRVMDQVAAARTVVEFARLLGVAPLHAGLATAPAPAAPDPAAPSDDDPDREDPA